MSEKSFPFFADGEDAHAQFGCWACVGERQQVRTAPIVEENQVHVALFLQKKEAFLVKKSLHIMMKMDCS